MDSQLNDNEFTILERALRIYWHILEDHREREIDSFPSYDRNVFYGAIEKLEKIFGKEIDLW